MNSEAVAEPASPAKGRIIPFGKYLLLQRVSVGGMAEVFKAIPEGAERIDQIIAVKRILPNIAEDNEFIGMFIDEARIAGQLNHPNICRIYELGRVGGDHYIAMQFLWGRDLLKVMNRFKKTADVVPAPMAAFVASKACAALHYAHTKRDATGARLNIIHRDVSPQNIIVGYSGQVKLIDFGVARAASQSQKTQAGILKGKFGYMSPEMIRGLPVDHRSDVFAMGICLHEALTGSRLFFGETDFATLELVRDARVQPPSAKVPDVPPALDAIVLKALARDAEDRYASALEMQNALDGFLSTLYPGYGEADVGAVMRQAFGQEVSREKQRVEIFANMLQRGQLVRGAVVPALPPESAVPSSGEQVAPGSSPPPPDTHNLTKKSPLTEDELARLTGEPDVQDEQTQIFFSTAELDEILEIASEPRASIELPPEPSPRQPTASDMVMRNESAWTSDHAHESQLASRSPTTSGTFPKSAADSFAAAARGDERRIPTMTLRAASETTLDGATDFGMRPARASRRALRIGILVLLALVLLASGYAFTRLAQTRSASLQIAAVGDPDALVRVDGVLRGNAPLSVDGLAPGLHEVEIDARGFLPVRMTVHVEAGEERPVNPLLERAEARPPLAPFGREPVVEARTESPPASAPLPSERVRPAPAPRPRRAATTPSSDATGTPDEPRAVDVPTQTPTINQEALAEGKGELLISTVPWAHVFIDGVDSGRDTPVRALRVDEGAHRIGLRTPDGVTHDVDVFVEAGQVVRIIRQF